MTSTTYDPFNDGAPTMPTASEPWFATPDTFRRYGGGVLTCVTDGEPPFGVVVPPIPDGWEHVPGSDHVIRRAGSVPDPRTERAPEARTPEIPAPARQAPTRSPKPRSAPADRKGRRRASKPVTPTTGVETYEPAKQNDHTLAMINSHQLTHGALLVAMVISVEIAITASREDVPFGQAARELTHDYLAGKTGYAADTVKDHAAKAVRLGFLERVDDGQGGKPGTGNGATYRARLPVYMRGHSTKSSSNSSLGETEGRSLEGSSYRVGR